MTNQFGLKRDIPDPVKRTVRQRCGFGCVVCAGSIYEYEHFNPEYSKAREHRAEGITLLCPGCHAKKTRNLLSTRRVREANDNPAARERRYAFSELEGTPLRPFVRLAGITLKNCMTPLLVRGYPLLRVEDAEVEGAPYRLSATFFDKRGTPSLFIRQNEWAVLSDAWDVEMSGPGVTVRTGPGEIALRLVFHAGEGLVVERLDMFCAGYRLIGSPTALEVHSPGGGVSRFEDCIADNCNVGLSLG